MAGIARIPTALYKTFFLGYEADDAWTYTTLKRVIVRDKSLSMVHSTLSILVAIFAFSQVVLKREFLTSSQTTGITAGQVYAAQGILPYPNFKDDEVTLNYNYCANDNSDDTKMLTDPCDWGCWRGRPFSCETVNTRALYAAPNALEKHVAFSSFKTKVNDVRHRTHTGKAQAGSNKSQIVLPDVPNETYDDPPNNEYYKMGQIKFTGGAGSGQTANILNYDASTRVATFTHTTETSDHVTKQDLPNEIDTTTEFSLTVGCPACTGEAYDHTLYAGVEDLFLRLEYQYASTNPVKFSGSEFRGKNIGCIVKYADYITEKDSSGNALAGQLFKSEFQDHKDTMRPAYCAKKDDDGSLPEYENKASCEASENGEWLEEYSHMGCSRGWGCVFRITEILELAGIFKTGNNVSSIDEYVKLANGDDASDLGRDPKTSCLYRYRAAGANIRMHIVVENYARSEKPGLVYPWESEFKEAFTSAPVCRVHFEKLEELWGDLTTTEHTDNQGVKFLKTRQGLQMAIQFSGDLCKFDELALITTLTAAYVLLRFANSFSDLLALKVMSRSSEYKRVMLEYSDSVRATGNHLDHIKAEDRQYVRRGELRNILLRQQLACRENKGMALAFKTVKKVTEDFGNTAFERVPWNCFAREPPLGIKRVLLDDKNKVVGRFQEKSRRKVALSIKKRNGSSSRKDRKKALKSMQSFLFVNDTMSARRGSSVNLKDYTVPYVQPTSPAARAVRRARSQIMDKPLKTEASFRKALLEATNTAIVEISKEAGKGEKDSKEAKMDSIPSSSHNLAKSVEMSEIRVDTGRNDSKDTSKDFRIAEEDVIKELFFELAQRSNDYDDDEEPNYLTDGYVSHSDLVRLMYELGINPGKADRISEQILGKADSDGSGMLNYEEFSGYFLENPSLLSGNELP
eukprot:g5442.t1